MLYTPKANLHVFGQVPGPICTIRVPVFFHKHSKCLWIKLGPGFLRMNKLFAFAAHYFRTH